MCNASDNFGRYTYSRQPEVCRWNLQKLAEALEPELPTELAGAILAEEYDAEFRRHYLHRMRGKLGLVQTEREEDATLVARLLETMQLTGEWATHAPGATARGTALEPLLGALSTVVQKSPLSHPNVCPR